MGPKPNAMPADSVVGDITGDLTNGEVIKTLTNAVHKRFETTGYLLGNLTFQCFHKIVKDIKSLPGGILIPQALLRFTSTPRQQITSPPARSPDRAKPSGQQRCGGTGIHYFSIPATAKLVLSA